MEFITKYISQKGKSHDMNEDNFFIHDDYIIVADGMGGASCGEVASRIAILSISSTLNLYLKNTSTENEIKELSLLAIRTADQEILKYERTNPEAIGMGTTIVLMIRKQNKGYVSWCGDSRCYLYSDGGLYPVTKDHSYVQELIDKNIISVDEAFSHPKNNLITKFLGGGEDFCLPDFKSIDLNHNPIIILCSDGLSGYCKNEEIQREISCSKPEKLPLRLLNLAVKNGSDDDITIAIMTPKKKRRSILDWLICKKK